MTKKRASIWEDAPKADDLANAAKFLDLVLDDRTACQCTGKFRKPPQSRTKRRISTASAMTLLLFNNYDEKEGRFCLTPAGIFKAVCEIQMLLSEAEFAFDDMLDERAARRKKATGTAVAVR